MKHTFLPRHFLPCGRCGKLPLNGEWGWKYRRFGCWHEGCEDNFIQYIPHGFRRRRTVIALWNIRQCKLRKEARP